ncbi:hypothetical protein Bcoa_1738 [Heyndrickxia coagulans 36D1]|uniref:Uncharacterized protein n=1 Tax=Heyndrickxia coagulans 36D1 TaxID=345219 RepID=G2TI00_HEYCO|nr:hypothetical protein Bcoa_1738 [Heyndrickxia coagulans 36D1]
MFIGFLELKKQVGFVRKERVNQDGNHDRRDKLCIILSRLQQAREEFFPIIKYPFQHIVLILS